VTEGDERRAACKTATSALAANRAVGERMRMRAAVIRVAPTEGTCLVPNDEGHITRSTGGD
jgi:hypothetical protein